MQTMELKSSIYLESWLNKPSILIESHRIERALKANEADVAYYAYILHQYIKRGVSTFNEE